MGGVDGLVTLNDMLEEITGNLPTHSDPSVVQRDDGSWLIDGSVPMDEFWVSLGLEERRGEIRSGYNTLGGLIVSQLGYIPKKSGDGFEE
jgi:putative hemolysin